MTIQRSFLTVEMAGQLVAIHVDSVQAVLPMDNIVPVPLAAPTVVGIATKRGHVLTVIDTRAAIEGGQPSASSPDSVIVNIGGHRYALLVDAIDEVVSIEEGDIAPPPPGMLGVWGSLATGMIRLRDDRRALVIRLEHFVEAAEGRSDELNHTITPAALEAAVVS